MLKKSGSGYQRQLRRFKLGHALVPTAMSLTGEVITRGGGARGVGARGRPVAYTLMPIEKGPVLHYGSGVRVQTASV